MEIKKKRFEVKVNSNYKPPKRAIFIDDELFDWEVDPNSLAEARKLGPKYYIAIQLDIEKHFLDSLSEFLGRKVSKEEVVEAHKTGLI
jgi:hypothetical protein